MAYCYGISSVELRLSDLSASFLAILNHCDLNSIRCEPNSQQNLLSTQSSVNKAEKAKPLGIFVHTFVSTLVRALSWYHSHGSFTGSHFSCPCSALPSIMCTGMRHLVLQFADRSSQSDSDSVRELSCSPTIHGLFNSNRANWVSDSRFDSQED